MKTFSELSLSPQLKSNLATHGFVQPTPVQAEAIPPALAGQDIVATAQTGTGKTLAFVLPVLESLAKRPVPTGISAVILSPTRELAIQIDETFAKLARGTGLRAAVVVGGLSEKTQLNAIRRGAQVLIATPGRLCDFLNRNLVRLGAVRILVLDEADRMLDMGFLPSLKLILGAMPAERQTMFFSATIETTVAHLVKSYLKDPVRIAIGSITKPVDRIDLRLYEVDTEGKLALLEFLLQEEQGSFLVFARTKRGADRLAKKLAAGGVKSAAIHGDRSQSQRNQALRGFQEGSYRALVATDVAARGIHVEGIAHVVNYDLPQAPEDFIHRVGRTGRAGADGVASTFATRADRGDIRKIEQTLKVQLTRRALPAGIPAPSPAVAMESSSRPVRPGSARRTSTGWSFSPKRRRLRAAG